MATAYEVVKSHYDANVRGDLEGMLAVLGDDCQWTEAAGFPCAGTYTGPTGVFENVFKQLGVLFDGYTFTLERLLDAGDTAIGIGVYTATCKATGKSFSARVTHVWDVADGKVRRFEQFCDTLLVAQSMQ